MAAKRRSRAVRLLRSAAVFAACVAAVGWFTFRQYRREALRRPLFTAIRAGETAKVQSLLERGADPNSRDRPDRPNNIIEIVKQLFRHDPNNRDEMYETALMAAASANQPGIAEMLAERGADVRAIGPNRRTAMHHAAAAGADGVVSLLAQHGADVNARAEGGDTPLLISIRDGRSVCALNLIKLGARADLADDAGSTPIFHAVMTGRPDLYEPLLSHGADPNTRDSEGASLLNRAIVSARKDIIVTLLKYNADPNLRAGDEPPLITALELAPKEERYDGVVISAPIRREIIALLLSNGANPNIADSKGVPALMSATKRERPDDMRTLLDARAKVDCRYEGRTPLMEAVALRNPRLVRFLLEHGADPNLKDGFGATPLMIAAFNGDGDIARTLLAKSAAVRVADAEGKTALQYAAENADLRRLLAQASGGR